MEAVPKLPMLYFDHKLSPENGEFAERLRFLVKDRYGENPETFRREIQEMETLRANSCIRPSVSTSGTDTIKKYYCQLHFLKKRFKIEDGIFNFAWNDCYLGVLLSYCDLEYEMASVLYNAGAIHSQLGARDSDRDNSDQMKIACTHFQCAAWVFHNLPDLHPKPMGSDMSGDLLAFLSQVCLAQAQECILEKSILDHRKSTIITKVCAQVAEYYNAALKQIENSNTRTDEDTIVECVGEKKSRSWTRYVEFKKKYFTAISYFYMGAQAEDDQQMGQRVALFQMASNLLADVAKLSKTLSEFVDKGLVASCLTFASDVINGKLENAKKENEFVFHEKVPDLDTLPELKGASLVKGIGFEVTNSDISGPDIFSRLVPYEAHEASSLYSEEKAKLLRRIGDEVEVKDSELDEFLTSLHLEEIPAPGDDIALPQELIECAAGLSAKGGDAITKLKDAMSRIASFSSDVESSLREIGDLFKMNDDEEASFEAICGKRVVSPKIEELQTECRKYEEAHKMASESNLTLHNAIQLHLQNLEMLTKPLEQIQKEIPSMADLKEEEETSIAQVRKLLAKVDEMKTQRSQLLSKLRSDIHEDDITKKLIVASEDKDNLQEVFDVELQKFNGQIQILRQNLVAQANICRALTETNAEFADSRRKVARLLSARKEEIDQLIASYQAYEDLLLKAAKGLEFYAKLEENVTKLLNNVKEQVKIQQEARDAKIASNVPDRPPAMMYPGLMSSQLPQPHMQPHIAQPRMLGEMSRPHMQPQISQQPLGLHVNANAPPLPTMPVRVRQPPAKPERQTLRQVMEQRKMMQGAAKAENANPNPTSNAPTTAPSQTPVMPTHSVSPGAMLWYNANPYWYSGTPQAAAVPDQGQTQPPSSALTSGHVAMSNQALSPFPTPGNVTMSSQTPAPYSTPVSSHMALLNQARPQFQTLGNNHAVISNAPSVLASTPGSRHVAPLNQARPQFQTLGNNHAVMSNAAPALASNPAGSGHVTLLNQARPQFQTLGNNHAVISNAAPALASNPAGSGHVALLNQARPQFQTLGNNHAVISNAAPVLASTPGSSHAALLNQARPQFQTLTNNHVVTSITAPVLASTPGSSHVAPLNQARLQFPTLSNNHVVTSITAPVLASTPGSGHAALLNQARPQFQTLPNNHLVMSDTPPVMASTPGSGHVATASQAGTLYTGTSNDHGATTSQSKQSYPTNGNITGPPSVPVQRPIVPQPGKPKGGTTWTPVTNGNTANTDKRQSNVDILSELDQMAIKSPNVLQPKVLTEAEMKELKREAQATEDIVKAAKHDPYGSKSAQKQLVDEVDKLESLLQSMTDDKSVMDAMWKRMQSLIEAEPHYGSTISVARCYPMKNRLQDVLPFDKTRVELPTTKDDYINASHIRDLGKHAPKFIATQAPKPNTLSDFWTMVTQEQVETIVCLLSEADLKDIYWPRQRKEPLVVGQFEISLQGVNKNDNGWTERTLTVKNGKTNTSCVTVHLQLNDYSLPTMVKLMSKVVDYQRQQRNLQHPVLVHCLGGSGKTALALMLATAIAEIEVGPGEPPDSNGCIVPDLVHVAALMCKQRKGIMKERECLGQGYQGVHMHCRDAVSRRGIDRPALGIADHLELHGLKKEENKVPPTLPGIGSDKMDLSRLAELTLSSPTSETSGSAKKEKITKQDFFSPSKMKEKRSVNPDDPLNQLDPFWTLK